MSDVHNEAGAIDICGACGFGAECNECEYCAALAALPAATYERGDGLDLVGLAHDCPGCGARLSGAEDCRCVDALAPADRLAAIEEWTAALRRLTDDARDARGQSAYEARGEWR